MIVEWREGITADWREFECHNDAVHDGCELAEWIIRDRINYDPANWNGFDGELEIRSPEKFAGTYEVTVEHEPRVSATRL